MKVAQVKTRVRNVLRATRRAAEWKWRPKQRCFNCYKIGHEARDCWFPSRGSGSNKPPHKASVAIEKSPQQQPANQD